MVIKTDRESVETYALLDDGSTKTIISERLADSLSLKRASKSTTLHTVEGVTQRQRELADFRVSNLEGDVDLEISQALVNDFLTAGADQPPSNAEIAHLDYMAGVSFSELASKEIGLLLSVDHSWTWLGGEIRRSTREKMIALKTRFGWALAGGAGGAQDSCLKTSLEVDNEEIKELLNSIFRRDFPPVDSTEIHPSLDDAHAIKQMEDTIQFDESIGHYRVGLPWKRSREAAAERLNPIDSSGHALNRLQRSIRKIKSNPPHDPPVAVELPYVKKQLGGIYENERAVFIEPSDVPQGVPSWVLPLHIVYEPNKPTKPRCCHDGASKLKGTCLNDHLLTGPDLLNSLLGVIFRFRENKVTLSADIKGFFHQVYVDKRDTYVFQFWWFEDEQCEKPKLSLIQVHIFGAKSSPTVCTFALRHHGKMMSGELSPEAAEAIIRSFYVDDLLASFKDVETARRVREELNRVMPKGGFELLKWKSSHPEVLEDPGQEQEDKDIDGKEDPAAMDKVLGVRCSFKRDIFCFWVKPEKIDMNIVTQRQLLQVIARCFDPIGLVAPFMLQGKLLFQQATADQSRGWDDRLDDELIHKIEKWRKQIPQLSQLEIARWFQSEVTEGTKKQLHVFADASQYAYGYVAYLRSQKGSHVDLRFVMGKSRVIPVGSVVAEDSGHQNSIPRFELTASTAAAEFFNSYRKEVYEEPEEVFFWSDSDCFLKQLRNRAARQPTFIKNRLSKIRTWSEVKQWHYVDTKNNPADISSRGLKAGDKEGWDVYLKGPHFLRAPEWEPPENPEEVWVAAVAEEVKKEPVRQTPFTLAVAARKSRWADKASLVARVRWCAEKWRPCHPRGCKRPERKFGGNSKTSTSPGKSSS